MKWYFFIHSAPFIGEFLGKLSYKVLENGEEVVFFTDTKIAEFSKRKYFPKDIKTISKVDWCIETYDKIQRGFKDFFWKGFFPVFDRANFFNFKFDYDDVMEMMSQEYQFFKYILEEEKPDVIIGESPISVLFPEIFSHHRNRTIFLGIIGSRFPGRIDIYDLENTCSKYEKSFKEMKNVSEEEKKFAKDLIEKFVSHKQLPSYMEYQNKIKNLGEIKRVKKYLKQEKEMWRYWSKYILNRKKFKKFDFHSELLLKYTFFYHPFYALKRRLNISFLKNVFNHLSKDNKFFLFPLHLQPEFSTSVQATYFCDQINTIRNIAFSLPFPFKLYVKEHPSAVGERKKNFYEELEKIPNVVLISPYENTKDLIEKSAGVITLTSTLGMEAALIGKPVYVLGNVFYSYHPLCKKVNSFEELKQKIEEDLGKKIIPDNLENINHRFVISYFRNTIPGDIVAASSQNDTNNYKVIYEDIKRIFLSKNGKT